MVRYLHVAALTIVALLNYEPARAQSRLKTPEGMATVDSTALLLASAQSHLSKHRREMDASYRSAKTALDSRGSQLSAIQNNQSLALSNIDRQLNSAISDLISADTRLSILPHVRRFNQGLRDLTDDFAQQVSGVTSGPYFQRKRDALSLMFEQLRQEVLNTRAIVTERKKNIEMVRDELLALHRFPNSPSSQRMIDLGFNHFINLRTAILANQPMILNDIASLNRGVDVAGNARPVQNPCSNGETRFQNFPNILASLAPYTLNFTSSTTINKVSYTEHSPLKWASERTEPNNASAKRSPKDIDGLLGGFTAANQIYYPGVIDSWGSCIGTKTNILNDLKSKIATEIARGNKDSAVALELIANDLASEINLLQGQRARLQQFRDLFSAVSSVATTAGYTSGTPALHQPNWKPFAAAHLYNLGELFTVEVDAFKAAIELTERAQTELESLGYAQDMTQATDRILPVASKLDAIARTGFVRLEEELTSAADTIYVMSANVRSSDRISNDGGLGEAISAFAQVVSIRETAMRIEQEVTAPRAKAEAESLVARVQAQRTETLSLYRDTLERVARHQALNRELTATATSIDSFFAIRSSHPTLISLATRFIASVSISAKAKREASGAMKTYLSTFPTVGSGQLRRPMCTGKNVAACKKVMSSRAGKSLKSRLASFRSTLAQSLDDNGVGILGNATLASLGEKLREIARVAPNV